MRPGARPGGAWRAPDGAGGPGQPCSCARMGNRVHRLSEAPSAWPAARGWDRRVGFPGLAADETEVQGQRLGGTQVL